MAFGNDAYLWYNVGEWADLGLAVPNWSNDTHSQNEAIRDFCQTMGRNLQSIMFHDDARQRTPPSINTLIRIHKLCVRGRELLASRSVPENKNLMESAHANPSPEVHMVYPVPYFKVRNSWMKSWCSLILCGLTDAMQHQENAMAIEISTRFGGQVGQYIQRVYQRMSVELFKVPIETAHAPDFTLTEEQIRSYAPSKWFTSTELIDTVPPVSEEPTEDNLEVLTNGIPVTQIPNLPRWPASVGSPIQGANNQATGGSTSFIDPVTA